MRSANSFFDKPQDLIAESSRKENASFGVFMLDMIILLAYFSIVRRTGSTRTFYTVAMNTQEKRISKAQLYAKGWTIAAAARRIGRATAHVNMVVNGHRTSATLVRQLWGLPDRPLELREKHTAPLTDR